MFIHGLILSSCFTKCLEPSSVMRRSVAQSYPRAVTAELAAMPVGFMSALMPRWCKAPHRWWMPRELGLTVFQCGAVTAGSERVPHFLIAKLEAGSSYGVPWRV